MDIQVLRIFARLAAVESLSAVATKLVLTPGTISKRLQSLEEELGVRLFDRNTRSVRITEEGKKLLGHAERILAEFELARATFSSADAAPRGRLKIAAPSSHGRAIVAPAIATFIRLYPDIEVHADLVDRHVNLQDEGYDIVIRSGVLDDSTLIAKRLAADPHVIVAAPGYAESSGLPRTPDNLADHACLVLGDQWSWPFKRGGNTRSVRVPCRLRSNSLDILHAAAVEGQGLMRVSRVRVEADLGAGRLVRVLPDYDATGDAALWAVYPSAKYVQPRLRAFLDFISDFIREAHPAERPFIAIEMADAAAPREIQRRKVRA